MIDQTCKKEDGLRVQDTFSPLLPREVQTSNYIPNFASIVLTFTYFDHDIPVLYK